MKNYEDAANSRDFNKVQKFVSDDAVFWFTDGSYTGIENVRSAFEQTWNVIKDEQYYLQNLKWIYNDDNCAVCLYNFVSNGTIKGTLTKVIGRGTSVLKKIENEWKVVHEHLSLDR